MLISKIRTQEFFKEFEKFEEYTFQIFKIGLPHFLRNSFIYNIINTDQIVNKEAWLFL